MLMNEPDAAQFGADAVGLFLDVDGTIVDFAPTPDSVRVSNGLIDSLASLDGRLGGALAFVSGRPIEQLDALFAPLKLRASGVHGGEIRFEPGGAITTLSQKHLPNEVWEDLQNLIANFPGAFAENKRFSFAVHYRFANASAIEIRAALQSFLRRRTDVKLQLSSGHLVYEIKVPGFDKGGAIERFMTRQPFAGRMPIFVADDAVDQPGVDKVTELGGVAYSVGTELSGVSGGFSRPKAVLAWLERLAR
jgi:trehalose 6-phosphate phosphatase